MNKKGLIILFILPIILIIVWFRNGFMLGGGESALPFYNIPHALYLVNYSWIDYNLGSPNLNGISSFFFYSTIGLLTFLFGMPWAQAVFFLFLTLLTFTGIYFLIDEFFPETSTLSKVIGCVFYFFNFISLVNIWNRFLYNHIVVWTGLPILLLIYKKGLRKKNYNYAILTSLTTIFFSFIFTSPAFVILVLSLLFFISIFEVFEKKALVFSIKYFLITLILFMLFNLWWISSFFGFVSSSIYSTSASLFFDEENLSTLSDLSSRLGQLSFTLRYLHALFFTNGPYWIEIFNNPLSVILEFIIPAIIFYIILKYRKVKSVLLLGSLYIFSLYLVKGNQPPFGDLFQFLFVKFSILQVFRNPFEKFGFMLILASVPLLSYGIDKISKRFKNRSRFLLACLITIVLFWGWPFWTGLVFTRAGTQEKELEDYQVKVPDYYKEADSWLTQNAQNSRFISLPIDGEGMTYTWEKKYKGVELSGTLFNTPNISFNTNIPYYSDLVSEISKYQINKKVLDFIPFTNSKYILWRGDIDYKDRRVTNPEEIKQRLESWSKEGLLTKKFESGKISIYEINSINYWPKIFIAQNILISNEKDLPKLNDTIHFNEKKIAILDSIYLKDSALSKYPTIIRPSKVFSPNVTKVIQNFTNDDLVARLFYVKHLPNEKFYFLTRWKELFATPPKSDYSGWILYRSGILGKRAVEIYKLIVVKASKADIQRAEKDYLNELLSHISDLSSAARGGGPVSEVVRDSLLYEWLLLQRSSSSVASKLSDYLLDLKIKPEFDLSDIGEGKSLIFHFDIPLPGEYKMLTNIDQGKQLLLDGKPLNIDTDKISSSSGSLTLEKGIHEIAFINSNSKEASTSTKVFEVSDEKRYKEQINLPDTPTSFQIDFDYLFKRGNNLKVSFMEDIDLSNSPILSTQINKDEYYHDWNHWTSTFTSAPGATYGEFEISPAEIEICTSSWFGGKICKKGNKINVEIKNLKIIPLENKEIYLAKSGKEFSDSDTKVNWYKINPTLYRVKINKTHNDPEVLVFSELFNSNWKLEDLNGRSILDKSHYLTNIYANGWLIDKAGDYDLVLKFHPQNILEKSRWISVFAVLLAIIYLLLSIFRKKNENN